MTAPSASIAQLVEVHRLAVTGQVAPIARVVGPRVCRVWLPRSRFAEAARLAQATLSLGPDAGALYDLGWAKRATGYPTEALAAYEQALDLYRTVGDRGNEAATLTNIGSVYWGVGQPQQALDHYQQALPIRRDVGDRAGEAVTRYNIAMIHRERGKLALAVAELEQVVDLDSQVQHPDLESDTAMLNQVRQELAR